MYDYSSVKYKHSHLKVIIGCGWHGDFAQLAADHLKGAGCPACAAEIRNVRMRSQAMRELSKKGFQAKYGVDNPFFLPQFHESAKLTWQTRLGVDHPMKSAQIKVKQAATNVSNGRWIEPALKDPWLVYRDAVKQITEQSFRTKYHTINPRNFKRGRNFHLDHMFSISEGFKRSIATHIVGHWTNLQLLPGRKNEAKGSRSSKTLDELLRDYNQNA